MASPPLSNNDEPSNISYDLHDFQTSIFIYLMGLILFILSVQIIERIYNLLRNENIEQLDIESDQVADHHLSIFDDFDWSLESMNNLWVWEIFNGFMAHLVERQDLGMSPEFLEQVSPCVNYKSLVETTLDECVICLEGLEDDELCRVFPSCNHVFHSVCLDHWMKNHLTCPICRNCIVDSLTKTISTTV